MVVCPYEYERHPSQLEPLKGIAQYCNENNIPVRYTSRGEENIVDLFDPSSFSQWEDDRGEEFISTIDHPCILLVGGKVGYAGLSETDQARFLLDHGISLEQINYYLGPQDPNKPHSVFGWCIGYMAGNLFSRSAALKRNWDLIIDPKATVKADGVALDQDVLYRVIDAVSNGIPYPLVEKIKRF